MPFSITDISNLTGIKAHTLRIWEQRYNFLKPGRTGTNIRSYSGEELKTILNVALLNKNGFKISHISKMDGKTINEKVLSLTSPAAKQDKVINSLIVEMIGVNMERFENILDSYIGSCGIEEAILQIIFPFLERIGILWATDHINPAQEHLVSNIIRQKILVGIELTKVTAKEEKQVCLFLPEGEFHELSLLFVAFLLKKQRISIIYLGANIPLDDVEFIVHLKKPDYLYTHITTAGQDFNFHKFLATVANKFPHSKIFISGKVTWYYPGKVPANIILKKTLNEVVEFVSGL